MTSPLATHRTTLWWRTSAGVALVGGSAVPLGIVIHLLLTGWSVLNVIIAALPVAAAGAVLMVWGLRRFTERVELSQDGITCWMLGKAAFVRFSDVIGVSETRMQSGLLRFPQKLFTVCDGHGRKIAFSSYLDRFDELVARVKSRIGEAADVECQPPRHRTLVNVVAVIILVLCMAALVWALWLNARH